jgi:peptidoglycan hydrolase-like protein with peptidoglycan-binding domain
VTTCVGRSSWTTRGGTTPNYELLSPAIGSAYVQNKNRTLDYEATWQGVKQIQAALIRRGYDPGPVDGWFGNLTAAAVTAFKKANGRPASSKVGGITARVLFGPDIASVAATAGLPEEMLCGVTAAESGFDPGAVGCVFAEDIGFDQLNIRTHTNVTKAQAFDVLFALRWTAAELLRAGAVYDRLTAPRVDRDAFVIANHNWPVGSLDWAKTGVSPFNNNSGESLAGYVARVLAACS